MTVHKVHKNGTVLVPRALLKKAGFRPGLSVVIHVSDRSLVIERAGRPEQRLKTLKRLRGSLKHLDWDTVRSEVQTRWSEWRDRRSA